MTLFLGLATFFAGVFAWGLIAGEPLAMHLNGQ